jgi:hypothetical protein
MIATENTEHEAEALALLLYQFKGKARVEALAAAPALQVQALESAAFGVHFERFIDNAQGAQLDAIGRIVREERRGSSDVLYRNRIRVRILINRSNARIPEILAILVLFEGVTGAGVFLISEPPPAAMVLEHRDLPVNPYSEILIVLRAIKAAGVRLDYVIATTPGAADSFVFGTSITAPTLSPAQGFGSVYDPSVGGELSSVRTV